jgi:hypothetical protein
MSLSQRNLKNWKNGSCCELPEYNPAYSGGYMFVMKYMK